MKLPEGRGIELVVPLGMSQGEAGENRNWAQEIITSMIGHSDIC